MEICINKLKSCNGFNYKYNGLCKQQRDSKMSLVDIENRLQQIGIYFLVGHFF